MKLFECEGCGNAIYFENTLCEGCGRTLGFRSDRRALVALDAVADDLLKPLDDDLLFRACANREAAATGSCRRTSRRRIASPAA